MAWSRLCRRLTGVWPGDKSAAVIGLDATFAPTSVLHAPKISGLAVFADHVPDVCVIQV